MDISNFRRFGKKIICIGRNYKALAAEQGNPIPKSPIVFLKPTTSYIEQGETIKELQQRTCQKTVQWTPLLVMLCVWDFQCKAKADGQPWALAKGFDTSCPVSKFIPKEKIPDTNNARLWLKINGKTKQDSSTSDMIFTVPQVISYLSQYFTLEPGDIILTGSPAGAGPVSRGEIIEAGLEVDKENVISLTFSVQ